jgi:hypothetical protein
LCPYYGVDGRIVFHPHCFALIWPSVGGPRS